MEATPFIFRPSIFDKDRIVTNRATLQAFSFCFITWIASLTIAFHGNIDSSDKNEDSIETLRQNAFANLGLSCLIAGIFTIILLAVMRHVPRFSYIVFGTFWIPMFFSTQNFNNDPNFSNILLVIVSYLSCVFTLHLLKAEWLDFPERVLKESCKVLMFFKSAISFVILLNIICVFILYIMITATVYFITLESPTGILILIIILNIIISVWTVLIISCIGHMTLSGVYATWFWTEDENKTWNNTGLLLRSLKLMCTYHIGTAAYAMSPIGLINTFFELLAQTSRKYKADPSTSSIIFVIYNVFDCVIMRMTLIGATAKCAINGTDYQVSAKEALEDFKKHPKRCLVVTKVLEYVLLFFIVILTVCIIFCLAQFINTEETNTNYYREITFLTIGSLVFIQPIFWMLIPASYAILFCVIEDLSIHDGSQERAYAMSYNLQEALDRNGPPTCVGCWMMCIGFAQLWFLFLIWL